MRVRLSEVHADERTLAWYHYTPEPIHVTPEVKGATVLIFSHEPMSEPSLLYVALSPLSSSIRLGLRLSSGYSLPSGSLLSVVFL
jgi:hypothetical protein